MEPSDFLLYALTGIAFSSRWALTFKKVAMLIARGVLIKTNLFTPELTRAFKETAYLLLNNIQEIVIYSLPIS